MEKFRELSPKQPTVFGTQIIPQEINMKSVVQEKAQ